MFRANWTCLSRTGGSPPLFPSPPPFGYAPGLKINWNRDINGQRVTISEGRKSKFVNFPFLSTIFLYIKSYFISFNLAKEMGKTKIAYSFIENKDIFFSPWIQPPDFNAARQTL